MNRDDFHQAYSDCVVSFITGGKKIPFLIEEIRTHSDEELQLTGNGALENGEWRSGRLLLGQVNLEWPELGLFNHEEIAIHVSRFPSRQWRRGMHRNTVRWNLISWDIGRHYRADLSLFSPEVLYSLYNPITYTIEESLEHLQAGQALSRAITSEVFLGLSMSDEDIVFGYKDVVAGTYSQGSFKLNEEMEPFRETLEDVLGEIA